VFSTDVMTRKENFATLLCEDKTADFEILNPPLAIVEE